MEIDTFTGLKKINNHVFYPLIDAETASNLRRIALDGMSKGYEESSRLNNVSIELVRECVNKYKNGEYRACKKQ